MKTNYDIVLEVWNELKPKKPKDIPSQDDYTNFLRLFLKALRKKKWTGYAKFVDLFLEIKLYGDDGAITPILINQINKSMP